MVKNTNALIMLRRRNKADIAYRLMSRGVSSRIQLSHELGLTQASVTQLVQELINDGIVHECGGIGELKKGRRQTGIVFYPTCYAAIGVNIESDNTHISICSWDKVWYEEIFSTAQLFENGTDAIAKILKQLIVQWNIEGELLGISVGIVGAVDEQEGIAINSYGILPSQYQLKKELEKAVGREVDVVNNVKAQARSLITLDNENFLYLKHSPGIGCALVAHGQTVDGANGRGCELGHTVVKSGGLKCRCGKAGCLEAYAVESRIVEVYRQKTGNKASISEIYASYTKDNAAKEVLDEVLEHTALSICNAAMITNPQRVLVTGGMFINDGIYSAFLKALERGGIGVEIKRLGNESKIKAFAEAKHLIKKRLFEV